MPKQLVLLTAALLTLGASICALADPPSQAPAHGWRKKHDPAYVGYTGTKWDRDFEISTGHCNREEIGAVIGGVVGGVVGSRSTSPENRAVATIIGAAAGAFIGSQIGRQLDDADRGCFGHALEIGKSGQRVSWLNPATGVSYVVTPGTGQKQDGRPCRSFVLAATQGGKKDERRGTACQSDVGVWNILD